MFSSSRPNPDGILSSRVFRVKIIRLPLTRDCSLVERLRCIGNLSRSAEVEKAYPEIVIEGYMRKSVLFVLLNYRSFKNNHSVGANYMITAIKGRYPFLQCCWENVLI